MTRMSKSRAALQEMGATVANPADPAASFARMKIGFMLITITIGIIGVAYVLWPKVSSGPTWAFRNRCILHNLSTLDQIKQAWALDHHSPDGTMPTETDLAAYFNGGKFLQSLSGEHYSIRAVGEFPTAILGTQFFQWSPYKSWPRSMER